MNKIIAVDFDGTLCEDKYPYIGSANKETIRALVQEKRKGAKLILWTCRRGRKLMAAVAWCKDNGLAFDAINENLPEVIEMFGRDTRKIYADVYLDDKAVNSVKELK
jgi:histidinol phosphatase-like enzyme